VAEGWGHSNAANTWEDIQWRPLAERAQLTPEQLEECSEVYFLDRSREDSGPPTIAQMVARHELKATSLLIEKAQREDGTSCVVFSAPTSLLLETRARRFPNLAAVTDGPLLEEAVDLRHIGRAPLLVSAGGTNASKADREQIRLLLARDMRTDLRLQIDERGSDLAVLNEEVALQQLLGGTDTAKKLRQSTGARYVWMFTLTEFEGATEYMPSEKRISPDPPAFSEPEPQKPSQYEGGIFSRRKKHEWEMERDMRSWQNDHDQWERRKVDHEQDRQNAPIQWERSITRVDSAHARGVLRLVDLQDVGKVIWETSEDCRGTAREQKFFKSDRTTIRGLSNKPESLDTPVADTTCPQSVLCSAARAAGQEGLMALRERAWLPEAGIMARSVAVGNTDAGDITADPAPKAAAVAEIPARPAAPTPTVADVAPPASTPAAATPLSAPQVAMVDGTTVTLTIGEAEGVRVGDTVIVALKTKEIKHPQTGKILEVRVEQSLALKVVRAGKTADCVPVNDSESEQVAQVKEGMAVEWKRAIAPVSPSPATPPAAPTQPKPPASGHGKPPSSGHGKPPSSAKKSSPGQASTRKTPAKQTPAPRK